MQRKFFFTSILLLVIVTSCKNDLLNEPIAFNEQNEIKIAVVSDIHYMAPSLLKNNAQNGDAFQNYLNADPKLVEYSDPIFRETIHELRAERPDILLIPGDLTKDGELVSHTAVAGYLKALENCHIKIFVVPGNHDINNPESVAYDGNNASPTPSISAADFTSIYSDFGYHNALFRDPNSLSYCSEITRNLWLLGIDDCKYDQNGKTAVVSGKIKAETMQWIKGIMQEAARRHITVFAMMHHNLIEHYSGETQFDPGYVTDNYPADADTLMHWGIEIIFTGHYHANDITLRNNDGKTLYDVETGSLVNTPSPYRIITFKNNGLDINTNHITQIPATLPGNLDFPTYSRLFLSAHLDGIFTYVLGGAPFYVPDPATYAPLFRNAYMAHLAGDEKITPQEKAKDEVLAQISPVAGIAVSSLWTDLPPKDNQLHIHLTAR